VKFKVDNSLSRISALFVGGFLLCPLQTLASGMEARRAYVASKYLLALQLAQPAAEQGDATAMLVLGTLHFRGEGVHQDYATALRWWRAAAALGNIRAQNNIGVIFRGGLGVERNYNEAIRWFELAASNDEPYAYWNLGLMHENGEGLPVDIEKALEFYKKSESLFRKELMTEPENHKTINKWTGDLSYKIRWLTSLLAQPKPTIPVPSTPSTDSGQQTTPK
jgi:tetratricopeptide (TPR) repeat protein